MSHDRSGPSDRIDSTRRTFLMSAGTTTAIGLAGCLGGGGDDGSTGDDGSSDGGEPDDEGAGGDDDGSSSGADSDDGMDQTYPDWDPESPELPQLASTLVADDFHVGTASLLDQMAERDEPRYGNAPPSPDEADELLDPEVIEFAMVPAEEPNVYRDAMDPLLENIEAETGIEAAFNPIDSYAGQVEAMRSERLHVAGFSTGTVPFAVNLAGAVPFSIQIETGGRFGYKNWLITQADSDIWEPADIAGRDVAHTEEASNSGHQAPSALLPGQGVEPDEDYEIQFSGGHDNSIRGVSVGDYDAAPIASTVLQRMHDGGEIDGDEIRVVWSSDPFPTTGFCYRYNLDPEIVEGVRRAHLEYDYGGTAMEEFFERGAFTEIDYATHWDVILEIQQQNGVDYGDGL